MSLAQGCGARQRARAVRGVTEGRWFDLKAGKGGSRGKKFWAGAVRDDSSTVQPRYDEAAQR